MLERIRKLIDSYKDRETYFALVGRYFPYGSRDYLLIEDAYDTAKAAFKNEKRDGGERYFEHLRGTSLIVMEYMRVRDAEVIAATLLHDLTEDIEGWAQERVALKFTPRISELVWWVTKPDVNIFNGDKEARNRAYHENLRRAPREAIIIKLADRMHNLLTLWDTNIDKQLRKIRETQDFYLPLAELHILLIHEIEAALDELMHVNQDK